MARRAEVDRPWLRPREDDGADEARERTRNGRQESKRSGSGDGGQGDSMGGVLKRTIRESKRDNLTDWAAAMTYYGSWRSSRRSSRSCRSSV